MENKKVFTVCARRWFDKANGNSYYTLRVVCPDGSSEIADIAYGHGDATYKYRAIELVRWSWGFSYEDGDRDMDKECFFVVDEMQVTRKKDLHNSGKR